MRSYPQPKDSMFYCSTFVRRKSLKINDKSLWRQLFGRGSATFWKVARNGRILLGVVAVIVLSQVWNVSLEAMASRGLGTRIAESLFDIVITLILASAGWGILKTAINRQLPHETLDALAMAAGEVLGTGLSRLETLLPLLRKFVVVAMIVISSLGINIGPLLAGAGVVGIAVGFGAQTLVRDTSPAFFSRRRRLPHRRIHRCRRG
jgi:moderate conductance mechanosensitive channel